MAAKTVPSFLTNEVPLIGILYTDFLEAVKWEWTLSQILFMAVWMWVCFFLNSWEGIHPARSHSWSLRTSAISNTAPLHAHDHRMNPQMGTGLGCRRPPACRSHFKLLRNKILKKIIKADRVQVNDLVFMRFIMSIIFMLWLILKFCIIMSK